MYVCVINFCNIEMYSSFFKTKEDAIAYAEENYGVIRVELAHSKEPPVWNLFDLRGQIGSHSKELLL